MNNKEIALVFVLIIVGVVALSGVYYFARDGKGQGDKVNKEGMIDEPVPMNEVEPRSWPQSKEQVVVNLDNSDVKPETQEFYKNVDCENKKYEMAFILLAKDSQDLAEERLIKLSNIKDEFSQGFRKATKNLASMDVSESVVVYTDGDEYFYKTAESYNFLDKQKLMKKFYETHKDIYDFVTIYTTPSLPRHREPYQHHDIVVQSIEGIGKTSLDFSKEYGSGGKLKGINFMDNIDNYSVDQFSINGLLHETGHQWCCYVGENFSGNNKAELEIIQQGIHFYVGLQSIDNQSAGAMGASYYWISNGDGTFRAEVPQELKKYHSFQLYFMGLLPKEEYSVKFDVYNVGVGSNFNGQRAILYKKVNVYDIIESEGERKCVEN